jgi:hypothetical protein
VLDEIEHAVARFSNRSTLVLVDAAAGKSYVGLLAARLLLEPMGRDSLVVMIERDPGRMALSRRAAEALQSTIPIQYRAACVGDRYAWPDKPSLVVALHACGAAADAIIEQSVAAGARMLLLAPCCTSRSVDAAVRAESRAGRFGIPHHAPVRRRFIQAMVDAERTWVLEAAGYETEVIEFVAPTVTPHNLLWRARRVREPVRMSGARDSLAAFQNPDGPAPPCRPDVHKIRLGGRRQLR